MDSRTISLVRTTFKAVVAEDDGPERLARSFYSILFTDYPGIRELFPAAMDAQRDRLLKAIAYVVDRLEEPDKLMPFLAQLGRDHRKYGTTDGHYIAVGNSLIKALRTFSGTEMWNDEVDAAWAEAIGVITETMLGAAKAETSPPVWSGRVVEHQEVLRNLAVIRLQMDQPMSYVAGQYVSVQIPARPRMWRYLSPATPANDRGEIEFHVRAISGGWVSPSIVGHTQIGETWLIGAPLGGLGVPRDPDRAMVMVGCGTGIAPLRAQLMFMATRRANPKVHLFIAGHHPCDLYELESLWQLSITNPWLTVVPICENATDPWWYTGPPTELPEGIQRSLVGPIGDVIAGIGSWSDRQIQICGSATMIRSTRKALIRAGTPAVQISYDQI